MEKSLQKSILFENIPQYFAIVRLAPNIRLRPEYFGGLVYDRRNGNTLEVDRSTFLFLNLIKDKALKIETVLNILIEKNIIKKFDKSITETLQKLIELKIIEKCDELSSSPALETQTSSIFPHNSWLSAPETVHWAVTYGCNENCPDCYVQRFSFNKNELSTNKALELIDKIANWNVFQLALGGGEPFTRKDLPQLVQYAADRGLSVHITTGMLNIDLHLLESISASIKNLQFGIRSDPLLGPDSTPLIYQFRDLFSKAQSLGITPGVNLFLTRSVIARLEKVVNILVNIGFDRIILLRYKPPKNIKRWKSEHPDKHQLKTLHEKINTIIRENPQLNIRVDCALSFVQRHLPKSLATQLGIKGCVAADRILAVAPDGSVYPCSQLVHPGLYSGNLLESEPVILWDQSRILRKYRSFRTKKTFIHSWCGVCQAREKCGGCRVFAMDGLGGDPGCPEPLLPSLTQIGKICRNLDLTKYLKYNYTISVAEYMGLYGVSQQKAIKELNASPVAVSTTGKSAKKKKDTYEFFNKDIISDLQDAIGYESGGFPLATSEQISEWIEDSSYCEDYPVWINQEISHK